MVTISQDTNNYIIKFRYFPAIVDKVKRIPGRRYNGAKKWWEVPKENEVELMAFATSVGAKWDKGGSPEVVGDVPPLPELELDIPLKRQLFPYQANGVAYGLQTKRLIIGDQPGLGKTGQSIAIVTGAHALPCLVICPSSLKLNWQREWAIWTDKKAMILEGSVRNNWHKYFEAGLADVFIVNYESLKKYFVEKIDVPKGKPMRLNHITFDQRVKLFKSVVIDESHRCKSFAAQQTKFTKGICQGKEYILALTGTPVINKPKDLIAQLGIIDRMAEFGGYKGFVDRYCSGMKEASNLQELNYKLNMHCFYRRDKSEVLKDLPAKMRQVVYCEIGNRKEYAEAENDLAKYLKEYRNATDEKVERSLRGEVMVRIGALKNISARGKLKDVFEYIQDTLDSGEKLVLFCHLKEVINQVKERFPDAVSVTGDDSMAARQISVDTFQTSPAVKLIVCSIQAAGVGLTLTASSRVAFVELGWHPAIHDQCEDRCHRIGQMDSVQCTYFLGKDTIDEYVYSIINAKRDITNAITGAVDDVEESVLDGVLNLFSESRGISKTEYDGN